jgi:hypothetical protein
VAGVDRGRQVGTWTRGSARCPSKHQQKFRREIAQNVVSAAQGVEGALDVRVEDKRQGPPKLRNLPSLQKLCGSQTRPPPRYNEGTLIEAMQNAWRFVDEGGLRERLKEAKGIGTPATRAEIIGGLFGEGKQIVLAAHSDRRGHCRGLEHSGSAVRTAAR